MKVTVKINERFFEVEVGDLNARPVLAKIDCDTFEVWPVETGQAAPKPESTPEARVEPAAPRASKPVIGEPAAASGKTAVGAKAVLAPIPGVIVSINVKVGDEVVFGQQLCLLEAMKMKNSIRANRVGKIASISVCAGDHVRHGQILLEYSE
jgi:glutaconyl-CoA/methylmalonyl-CoA decarboxylase subunit gamma